MPSACPVPAWHERDADTLAVGWCANKISYSRHCLRWLPCLPAEKLAAAIQDLRKAEADKQKAMSQSAAANREADKLTQKLYK